MERRLPVFLMWLRFGCTFDVCFDTVRWTDVGMPTPLEYIVEIDGVVGLCVDQAEADGLDVVYCCPESGTCSHDTSSF